GWVRSGSPTCRDPSTDRSALQLRRPRRTRFCGSGRGCGKAGDVKPTCLLAVLSSLTLLGGCAASAASADPQQTLKRYSAAIADGDANVAYAMLSEQAKKRMSFEAFRRMLQESPEELEPL